MADDFQVLKRIFNAFDPFKPLPAGDPVYVDCQEVRGDGNILEELGKEIRFADRTTCQLYAGHRGAGKSTELLRLKKDLENHQFRVVYFAADEEDIDAEDTQYTDILLACTRHLMQGLKGSAQNPVAKWLQERTRSLVVLMGSEMKFEGVAIESQISQFAKLTATLKASPNTRHEIRREIEPHTVSLIDALNEFIAEAMARQNESTHQLVVIADSLDRITPIVDSESGRSNYDQIFIDRSEQLKSLNCHVVYTVPISMVHSNRASDMQAIYGTGTQVLPMVMVRSPDSQPYEPGIQKLKELICRRVDLAVPRYALEPDLPMIFDQRQTLEQLCLMSGGHVRDLLLLMQAAVKRTDRLPVTVRAAQRAISEVRETYHRTVDDQQWPILAEVGRTKEIRNDETHRNLLFRRCILEYRQLDENGAIKPWYDVHPLIRGLKEFQEALQEAEAR